MAEPLDAAVAAARLESLREFAYGAGHEINNPLANIAARAQALLIDEIDPERRRRLATIVDQAFRARDMIGGLMVFARPPKPVPARTEVDAILAPVLDAVRPAADLKTVRLEYSPPPASCVVDVDAAHITESIRLIAVNAVEAAAGRVVIHVATAGAGNETPCVVTVTDDGPGMSRDMLGRAFDPFFSGREAGRGIGLGLPKAWRLVEINGGTLDVDSRPGRGTRVSVSLPAAPAA
jgi:signal transduction histidine kinase